MLVSKIPRIQQKPLPYRHTEIKLLNVMIVYTSKSELRIPSCH